MAGYMVCWPQDRWKQVKKAGDTGPIKVIYGSIHARMPTIASIKVGDVVFVVTYMQKHLYAVARLPVTHREAAFDYTMRELGTYHSALPPKGVVMELRYAQGGTFFSSWDCKSYNCREAVPERLTVIPLSEQIELSLIHI